VLNLLAKHDAPGTFFIPGHTAWAWPDLVKKIHDARHEIGHHGWVHENPALLELDAEREVMERGFEALDHAVGVRPQGYRSAAWDFSRPQRADAGASVGARGRIAGLRRSDAFR